MRLIMRQIKKYSGCCFIFFKKKYTSQPPLCHKHGAVLDEKGHYLKKEKRKKTTLSGFSSVVGTRASVEYRLHLAERVKVIFQ